MDTHVNIETGPYSDASTVYNELTWIGVNHVRDNVFTGTPTETTLARVNTLGNLGIKFDFLFMDPPEQVLPTLATLAPYIDTVEGPNEINATPVYYNNLTGNAAVIAEQQAIYKQVKADTALSINGYNIPVLNFTVAQGVDITPFGDMSATCDYANVHAYMSDGVPPYYGMPWEVAHMTDAPGRPMIMTETNYNTLVVSENVQAKYDLDWLFDNMMHQYVARTYFYQLSDGWYNPTDTEAHWGLFNLDNTPKLAANALHNVMTILADSGANAATFSPKPVTYSLQGSLPWTPGQNIGDWNTAIQKSDGTNELILWSEPVIWNTATSSDVTGLPVNLVTVTLDKEYGTVNVYDPLQGAIPAQTSHNTNQVDVAVVDHPIIIEYSTTSGSCTDSVGGTHASGSTYSLVTSTGTGSTAASGLQCPYGGT